jgi:predicted transposase/invertase (TIGR01784 family)
VSLSTHDKTTRTPHDALFKAGFESPEHAAELLRQVLPKPVVDLLDWRTLRRESASFIDPGLTSRHGDLLFAVQLLAAPELEVRIYLMLEHQSQSHRDMCLRMLGYEVRDWERYRKQNATGPLPVIIPVVISHDPDGWTAARSFHDLFDLGPLGPLDACPELAQFVPKFVLRVEDLIEVDDEQLWNWQLSTFVHLTVSLLRDARTPERVRQNFPQWIELVRQLLPLPNAHVLIEQIFRYILQVAGRLQFEEFLARIQQQLPETQEIAMTIAEQLEAKGEAKAQAKAQAKARARLLRQMTLKFGALSAEHTAIIEAATEQQLDDFSERLLTEPTPEAVLVPDG